LCFRRLKKWRYDEKKGQVLQNLTIIKLAFTAKAVSRETADQQELSTIGKS